MHNASSARDGSRGPRGASGGGSRLKGWALWLAFTAVVPGCSLLDAPTSDVETLSIRPEFGANLAVGDSTLRLRAIAIVANRPVPAITANWQSSAPLVVSVDDAGVLTALSPGSAEVSATVQGRKATTKITVLKQKVLGVLPAGSLNMDVGQTAQLSAVESDGPVFWNPGLGSVTWSSEDPAIASVSASGAVTAGATGQTNIIATVTPGGGRGGTQTASVALRVVAPAALAVTPPFLALAVRKTLQLSAVATPPSPPLSLQWSSSNTAIATVSQTGLVTAVAAGPVQVTARSSANTQVRGTATLVVVPAAVATVSLTIDSVLAVGRSVQVTAVPRDADGLATQAPVTWLSSRPSVAVVSEDGVATGIRTGTSTISASAGGAVATQVVAVKAASTSIPIAGVSGGGIHTCGRTKAGVAFCWGENAAGQLGDGSNDLRALPTPVGGALSLVALTAGFEHSCGLTSSGAAFCWGDNSEGQLGDGTTTIRAVPTPVAGGLTFMALTAGLSYTCGIASGGAGYCWGANASGQLGDNSVAARSTPSRVAGGHAFTQIGAGGFHTCGVVTGGSAYCWGGNAGAQVGDSTKVSRRVPTPVAGGFTFSSLTVGFEHSCALTSTGAAYCWGRDFTGQVGNGSAAAPVSPAPVLGGLRFVQLTAGGLHSCGLTARGVAYCWGSTANGQLGSGGGNDELDPVRVNGNVTFMELTAGFQHTCGRATNGVTYCWGDNRSGQLGDGTRIGRVVPTVVR